MLPCLLKNNGRWAEICLSCIMFKSRGIPLALIPFSIYFSSCCLIPGFLYDAVGAQGWVGINVSFLQGNRWPQCSKAMGYFYASSLVR